MNSHLSTVVLSILISTAVVFPAAEAIPIGSCHIQTTYEMATWHDKYDVCSYKPFEIIFGNPQGKKLDFYLDVGPTGFSLFNIIPGMTITINSTGEVYNTEGTDSYLRRIISENVFNSVVSYLTNGIDDSIFWSNETGYLNKTGELESKLFFNDVPDIKAVDFEGYTISNISLTIENASIYEEEHATFDWYEGPNFWSSFYCTTDLKLSIDGILNNVPETPITQLLCFAIFISSILYFMRRSKKRSIGNLS